MLVRVPNIDAHFDMLEDIDGHMFKISAPQIARLQTQSLLAKIEKKILKDDKENTVIMIEEPPHRHEKAVQVHLKRMGRRVDGKRNHNIHAFFIPSELFKIMLDEIADWDEF